jgi:hypothetical protein
VVGESPDLPIDLFATAREDGGFVLTFEKLLWATSFVEEVRGLLATLRDAYRYPVDVEFTANFLAGGDFRLNLVQCRPLQVKEGGVIRPAPPVPEEAVLLSSRGPVIGQSTSAEVNRVVYVDPDAYATLATQDRYEVARVIGRLNRLESARGLRVLLLGPGRWGSTTVSLGVPVHFAEINRVSAICEILRIGDVVPDVSLGSHFFNDLVEANLLYLALYPTRSGHRLDEARLRAAPNLLPGLLPDDARLAPVVHVVDFPSAGDPRGLWLHADCVRQDVLAYLASPA